MDETEKTGIMLDSCKEINFTKHNLEILTFFAFGSVGFTCGKGFLESFWNNAELPDI